MPAERGRFAGKDVGNDEDLNMTGTMMSRADEMMMETRQLGLLGGQRRHQGISLLLQLCRRTGEMESERRMESPSGRLGEDVDGTAEVKLPQQE